MLTGNVGSRPIATHPETNRSCRIQVKSRWATDFDGGFPIRNFGCDFIVFVALNRGFRYREKSADIHHGRQEPQCYVFPVRIIQTAQDPANTWGKVFLRHVEDVEQYVNNWELVKAFLGGEDR